MVKKAEVHFECNNATDFVEVCADGLMWVVFAGERKAFACMKGKLKQVVHKVMVQHSFVSCWRG